MVVVVVAGFDDDSWDQAHKCWFELVMAVSDGYRCLTSREGPRQEGSIVVEEVAKKLTSSLLAGGAEDSALGVGDP